MHGASRGFPQLCTHGTRADKARGWGCSDQLYDSGVNGVQGEMASSQQAMQIATQEVREQTWSRCADSRAWLWLAGWLPGVMLTPAFIIGREMNAKSWTFLEAETNQKHTR